MSRPYFASRRSAAMPLIPASKSSRSIWMLWRPAPPRSPTSCFECRPPSPALFGAADLQQKFHHLHHIREAALNRFCVSWKSTRSIRRDTDPSPRRAQHRNLFQVLLPRARPRHPPQHRRGPALHRQVYVIANRRHRLNGLHNIFPKIPRVSCHKPNTPYPRHFRYRRQQFRKTHLRDRSGPCRNLPSAPATALPCTPCPPVAAPLPAPTRSPGCVPAHA